MEKRIMPLRKWTRRFANEFDLISLDIIRRTLSDLCAVREIESWSYDTTKNHFPIHLPASLSE